MNDQKPKRIYRKVTHGTVARFLVAKQQLGNGSAAVRAIEPDEVDEARRAWLISSKAHELDAGEYIDFQLQRGAVEGIERARAMIQSSDEKIASKNAHFFVEHVRGKPLQRSESKHLNLNIEAVLE